MPANPCRPSRIALLSVAGALGAVCAVMPVPAHAAPEEIVIFDDAFEKAGSVGYDLHFNYARRARKVPDYPGEQPPDRVLRMMPEAVFGLSEKWNLGVHVPMSHNNATGSQSIDGLKIRLQYLTTAGAPAATRFWGVNYEINYLTTRLSESRLVAEVRGIAGMRTGTWLLALNPILNRPLSSVPGVDNRVNVDVFGKVMRLLPGGASVGLEHYAELGRLRNPTFGPGSGQTTYAVVEFGTALGLDVHVGIGHGWTDPVDKRVYKVILGLPF